jgi:hypothetical protein
MSGTSSVEFEGCLESDAFLWCGSFGVGTLCGVQSVHVCLVVLFVVKLHDLAGDVRLKSVIWIREVWENV